jgi:hypothetical protein
MPYNPSIFLADYPGATVGGAISATEAAIATLSIGARLSALKQSAAQIIQAQGLIFQQNSGSRIIPNPMPLGSGVATVAAARDYSLFFGSTTYGAVSTIHVLDLATKSMRVIGSQLASTFGTATCSVSDPSNAYTFSPNNVDRTNFNSLVCSQASAGISAYGNSLAMPSGVGTSAIAILNIGANISVYTFATGVNATSGGSLNANFVVYASTVQSATNGYFLSGWGSVATIQRVVLSTRVISTLGATFPTAISASAGLSSATDGYSVGGFIGPSSPTAVTQRLAFSEETTSSVSANLTTALAYRHGSGSSATGATAGGSASGSGVPGVRVVDELTYSGEIMARLSAQLAEAVGLVSSSSTYSPAFEEAL